MNAVTTTNASPPTLSDCRISPRLWRLLDSNIPADAEIAEICSDRGLHLEAKVVADSLQTVAAPCGPERVKLALQPLVLVFGVSEAARATAFWNVYIKALADLPAQALAEAIDDYAASPEGEFFPKPGPLRALALKRAERIYKAAYRAKRAADSFPRQTPAEESLEERQRMAAEVLKLVGSTKSPA